MWNISSLITYTTIRGYCEDTGFPSFPSIVLYCVKIGSFFTRSGRYFPSRLGHLNSWEELQCKTLNKKINCSLFKKPYLFFTTIPKVILWFSLRVLLQSDTNRICYFNWNTATKTSKALQALYPLPEIRATIFASKCFFCCKSIRGALLNGSNGSDCVTNDFRHTTGHLHTDHVQAEIVLYVASGEVPYCVNPDIWMRATRKAIGKGNS